VREHRLNQPFNQKRARKPDFLVHPFYFLVQEQQQPTDEDSAYSSQQRRTGILYHEMNNLKAARPAVILGLTPLSCRFLGLLQRFQVLWV
jgi:hypothetical protein